MIFVDTGAWIALLDQRDGHHRRALAFQEELTRGKHGRLITTDYVLDEAATFLRRRGPSATLHAFRTILERSRSVEIVWTSPERFWSAWDLLLERDDKSWSLTDCVSFQTMRSLGIHDSFAFDSDFQEAGFNLLPATD
ncbi:MAG TPA: PIN domain-containing protein [Thermoplasmata archaeon]|nr:PIN domain-containing protein [Thermoplasmata archaeon]